MSPRNALTVDGNSQRSVLKFSQVNALQLALCFNAGQPVCSSGVALVAIGDFSRNSRQ